MPSVLGVVGKGRTFSPGKKIMKEQYFPMKAFRHCESSDIAILNSYLSTILIIITRDSLRILVHSMHSFVKALSLIYGWQSMLRHTDKGFSLFYCLLLATLLATSAYYYYLLTILLLATAYYCYVNLLLFRYLSSLKSHSTPELCPMTGRKFEYSQSIRPRQNK